MPLPNPFYTQYEMIELEIFAIKKKFPPSLTMVDESMLSFPTSVNIFTDKNFGKYFQENKAEEVTLKHSAKHYGYAIRLKYTEKLD